MKKTLIALAVATSAVVSGSAMAWTAGGNGGSVEIGGTLTPETVVLPWEVKTGSNIADLNAKIKKGQSKVDIVASKAIPVLGIRSTGWFDGKAGINPQINYGGAIDVQGFNREVTTLSLEVQNAEGNKIGSLTAPFFATAMRAYHKIVDGADVYGHRSMFAESAGQAFFGGLNTVYYSGIEDGSHLARVSALDPEIVVNFVDVGNNFSSGAASTDFNEAGVKFNSFYGSGIEKDQTIKITLDSPAESDAITWKASLPVVVSYQ